MVSDSSASGERRARKRDKHDKHKHKHKHKHEHKHKHKHKHKKRSRSRSSSHDRAAEREHAAAAARYLAAAAAGASRALAPEHAAPAVLAPAVHAADAADMRMRDDDSARAMRRAEAKRQRREAREELEELVPRATGREAKVEARIARREEARARDVSPDACVTGGGNVLGGTDSFAAALARQKRQEEARKQRLAPRQAELSQKLAAHAASEEATMATFRALLAGGAPLTIPKRT